LGTELKLKIWTIGAKPRGKEEPAPELELRAAFWELVSAPNFGTGAGSCIARPGSSFFPNYSNWGYSAKLSPKTSFCDRAHQSFGFFF